MALAWNEIRTRAVAFSATWEGEQRERAEKDSFWNEFFHVFGVSRRRVATFEEPVKKLGDRQGFIDLFWKGKLIVEHKSKGKDLDAAVEQATDYFDGLAERDLPRYVLVSDFARFRLVDLEADSVFECTLAKLPKHVQRFGFIAGYQEHTYQEEDPVNVRAAEAMGTLYDALKESHYPDQAVPKLLVRLLFCLFADDTGIFNANAFRQCLEDKTHQDGSDLGSWLTLFFQVLDTPLNKRQKTLDEVLANFPYVNGSVFEEVLPIASFSSAMRDTLIRCNALNWGSVSPAIFGSMFQSVMNPDKRRDLGAYYTSEENILKVIKPLFLDELHQEFKRVKNNRKLLEEFHQKLGTLTFLDPACGCGNFLIVIYRELRLLELEVLKVLHGTQQATHISELLLVNVDQFYGIEYDAFAVRIAEVAMWLVDHQMNQLLSKAFGQLFMRLPLGESATIVHGNALRMEWDEVVPLTELSYVVGNPPFYGKQNQNADQKQDMALVCKGIKGAGVLDYVTAWYLKAARLVKGTVVKVGFVSTNSVAQGEQASILWNELFNNLKMKIHFAHRTFVWRNKARGNAGVHVVIIGFGSFNIVDKALYSYNDKGISEANLILVKNINPYLVAGDDTVVLKRNKPFCSVPEIVFGSMANDGGHLLFTEEEKIAFLRTEPKAKSIFRPLIGATEFINSKLRWCLWLADVPPDKIKGLKNVRDVLEKVKNHRLSSSRPSTQKLASFPGLFAEIRQPTSNFLLIPRTTSENRHYIPIGFFDKNFIVNDSCMALPNATLYHFGVLTSTMHMTWTRYICGRLKSDYRYSNTLVYNNYPWPWSPTKKQTSAVEAKAQQVLDARAAHPNASLADLYDPLTMPPALIKAHQALDKAVDQCYRAQKFSDETTRMAYLFDLYGQYTTPLIPIDKPVKRSGQTKSATATQKSGSPSGHNKSA